MKYHPDPGVAGKNSGESRKRRAGEPGWALPPRPPRSLPSAREAAAEEFRGWGWGAEIPISAEEDEAWTVAEHLNAMRDAEHGRTISAVCDVS